MEIMRTKSILRSVATAIGIVSACLLMTANTSAIVIKIPTVSSENTKTWTPLFAGIDFMRVGTTTPLQQICVLRIDTQQDGLQFFTNGRIQDYVPNSSETERSTTVDFLNENNLLVAVNGSFYTPFNAQTRTTRGPANVTGLAISEGTLVSPPQGTYPAFIVYSNNVKSVITPKAGDSFEGIRTAVAGSAIILKDGEVQKQNEDYHPRTAVGISQDNRYVYLMTIDGRQATYSMGATLEQTGAWLKKFGAWDGINLDGGGSTTMVIRNTDGKAKVLNRPVGHGNIPSTLRNNANHLGIRQVNPKN